jgi:hypothetical protein
MDLISFIRWIGLYIEFDTTRELDMKLIGYDRGI